MTALTNDRLTQEFGRLPVPQLINLGMADNVIGYAGGMASWDGTGLRPARAVATDIVLGRFRQRYDNTIAGHTLGGITGDVEFGIFKWASATAGDAITNANIGKPCYAVDDQTVALTSAGIRPYAGTILFLDTDGLVVVMPPCLSEINAILDPSIELNPRVRCVASTAITIATALVTGQVIDGVTLLAGDRVLVVNQASAGQNGVYVAGAAPVAGTFAPDYVQGAVKAGQVFDVSEGTLWANSSWKATAAQVSVGGIYTVGTTDPVFMPRMQQGSTPIGTPFTTGFIISSNTPIALNDVTSSTTGTKAVLVAGRGNGTVTLTGTGTDTVKFGILNW